VVDPRSIVAVFPPDDRVALFVASMCSACNDVEAALVEAGAANPQGHPDPDVTHRLRHGYRIRMVMGHLFEAIVALKAWRQSEPGVQALLRKLDEDGRAALKRVVGLEQRLGADVLELVRHNSFHYAHPNPAHDSVADLAETIRSNPEVDAGIDLSDDALATFRFADRLTLGMAMAGHDVERGEDQQADIRDTAKAFVLVVKEVYVLYCRERGIGFEFVDEDDAAEEAG
jgi:hypothetical protein